MTASVQRSAPRPVTPLSILAEMIDGLRLRLVVLPTIDDETKAELSRAAALAGGLDAYVAACTSPESPALRHLAERTAAEDWGRRSDDAEVLLEQEMLSGHVEGQALKFLVRLTRAQKILEIGMFTGYSALAMAEALPAGGRLIACELDVGAAEIAQECFDATLAGAKIDVRIAPAMQTLQELASADESFDLVFIDADKSGYVDYLNHLLAADLVAPGGVICVDNTLMQGQPWLAGARTANGAAIEEFNRTVAADNRVEQVLLPLRDGLTLIRRVEEPS